jgi:hypothetical protein
MVVNDFPLISPTRHEEYDQYRVGNYFIMTQTDNPKKKRILERIATALGVEIKVDII